MRNGISTHRVVTFLDREELEFLDRLERDMMFSTGRHISRSKIIEDMVNLLLQTHMTAGGIRSDLELREKMKEAITKVNQQTVNK